ncbi:MAG: hypothetical protein M1816_001038 [Peltula sp. TS41687]|nr:MAG: hypothetical protein M1816_001038 [Peltula sp. TS41687]
MANIDPKAYWGYLFKPDRSPTELLDALLTGIANYIKSHIEPKTYDSIVPTKLASFYQGNYDSLFVETDHSSLSFIYQSLGCNHSLVQPIEDDFAPPSIPALSPRGFIRFQSIQLLLDPEEHWAYLQEAVRRFDIIDPRSGKIFPRRIPREAFPEKPDEEMVKWHDMVMDRLRKEAQNEPVGEERGFNDAERPADGRKGTQNEDEDEEEHDYFSYYPGSRQRPTERSAVSEDEGGTPTGTPEPEQTEWRSRDVRNGQTNVRSRRRSVPEEYIFPGNRSDHHTRDPPSPSSHHRRRYEPFDPTPSPGTDSRSTAAATTTSGSESGTEDNASETSRSLTPSSTTSLQQTTTSQREPSRRTHHQRYDIPPFGHTHTPDHDPHRRRHSVESSPAPTYEIRTPAHFPNAHRPAAPPIPGIVHIRTAPAGPGPPRANYRGANVRWSNESSVYTIPPSTSGSSAPSTPGSEYESPAPPVSSSSRSRMISSGSAARYALPERREVVLRRPAGDGDGDGDDRRTGAGGRSVARPQIRRLYSPLVGVDGRRYPSEAIIWR